MVQRSELRRLGYHRLFLPLVFLGGIQAVLTVPAQHALAGDIEAAKSRFFAKIESLRWITYSPSTFDPGSKKPVTRADVKADLHVLRQFRFDGIITYSCSAAKLDMRDGAAPPKDAAGFDDIPRIAKDLGIRGFIAGVWDPKDKHEIAAAKRLARERLIDAVCVGNEGLDERYSWNELRDAMRSLRTSAEIPVTTTEQIDDYGLSALRNHSEVDWIFPNIHPVFRNIDDPKEAAQWTILMVRELKKLDEQKQPKERLPIFVKETGWPTRGLASHNEHSQKEFWDCFGGLAAREKIPYATFEAFDQPWKREDHLGENIGVAWGVFTSLRKPKSVISSIGNKK